MDNETNLLTDKELKNFKEKLKINYRGLLTLKQAGYYVGFDPSVIIDLIERKKLFATKINNQIRISKYALDQYFCTEPIYDVIELRNELRREKKQSKNRSN